MSVVRPDGPRIAFTRAAKLLKSSAYAEAERRLRAALGKHPGDPNLLRLRGVALAKLDRWGEARRSLLYAIEAAPELAITHENLAEVLLHLGSHENAVKHLEAAKQHDPNSRRAGEKLRELAALADARTLSRRGESAKAAQRYRELLTMDPNSVVALRMLGVLCVKRGNYADGETYLRAAVELAPDFWQAWISLGIAFYEQQKFLEAEGALKQALKIVPQSVRVMKKLGVNAMGNGRSDEAVAWFEKALEIDETHMPSVHSLGHALKAVGRREDAIAAYLRCLEAQPDRGEFYWSLANMKTFRFSDEQVTQMRMQLRTGTQAPHAEASKIAFLFSLGKAAEDRKDYAAALDYYMAGNRRQRSRVNYDPTDFQRLIERIKNVCSKSFFDSIAGMGCEDDSPILIVGLPRCGSTLLEQILASHPQVEGTAELHYLPRIAAQTGLNRLDGIGYPECLRELQPNHFKSLGEQYIENTLSHRSGARFFIDKMPNNFMDIGFLHAVLPNAKVIDARRHPVDSCLSAYKQLFARGQYFSYDLYELAHYYNQYQSLMDHWTEVLPGKVLTIRYEDVVDDLETQVRRMALHCGLEWEESMLRFYETERSIWAASSEQVRQPIYRGSVNHWRNYGSQLEELIGYLAPSLATHSEAWTAD